MGWRNDAIKKHLQQHNFKRCSVTVRVKGYLLPPPEIYITFMNVLIHLNFSCTQKNTACDFT